MVGMVENNPGVNRTPDSETVMLSSPPILMEIREKLREC